MSLIRLIRVKSIKENHCDLTVIYICHTYTKKTSKKKIEKDIDFFLQKSGVDAVKNKGSNIYL